MHMLLIVIFFNFATKSCDFFIQSTSFTNTFKSQTIYSMSFLILYFLKWQLFHLFLRLLRQDIIRCTFLLHLFLRLLRQDIIRCTFLRHYRSPKSFLHCLTRLTSYTTTFLGHTLTLLHRLRIRLPRVLCRRHFRKRIQRQLDIRHVIPQILLRQAFEFLILPCRHAAPCLRQHVR